MRFQRAICFMAMALASAQALASSIVTPGPSGYGSASSIIAAPETPANDKSSVVTIGNPAPSIDEAADITVIRGGEIGGPLPPPEPEAQPYVEPMLDPNDRGTPAKRNALKRQAERLAAEEAARQNAQPTP